MAKLAKPPKLRERSGRGATTKKSPPTRRQCATAIRALAEKLQRLDTDDLRLAADVLHAVAFPVEFFEAKENSDQRVAWTQAMVTALNALGRKWSSDKRWWLCAVERATLETEESKRKSPGVVLAP